MKKIFIFILLVVLTSCLSTQQKIVAYCYDNISLSDSLNNAVIDGFFNGDTTKISQNIYLLKPNCIKNTNTAIRYSNSKH